MKKTCEHFLARQFEIEREAAAYGIEVRVSVPKDSKRNVQTLHVMFDSAGKRILDYWPGTGTFMNTKGRRGKAPDPESALAIAIAHSDAVSEEVAAAILEVNEL